MYETNNANLCSARALMLLMPTTALAYIGSLATTPEPPSCDDVIVLAFTGSFPDSCWSISSLEFVADGSSETIGPLPAGDYHMFAFEQRNSQRDPGAERLNLPTLTCCDGSSAEINDMRLAKTPNGHAIKFSWSNANGASELFLLASSSSCGEGPEHEFIGFSTRFIEEPASDGRLR